MLSTLMWLANGAELGLLMAASSGELNMVKFFLWKGVNVNAKADFGDGCWSTPLLGACRHGQTEVVKLLLERGADVHLIREGVTVLHEAASCCKENGEVVRLLLGHGANIDAIAFDDGWTPLHAAISWKGHAATIQVLLESGANVHATTQEGLTCLHTASAGGYDEAVKLFLKHGANVRARTNEGGTPLHEASFYGWHTTVQLLLEHGADVNATCHKGRTPLLRACMFGAKAVIAVRLAEVAHIDNTDDANAIRSAIVKTHVTRSDGHDLVVRTLLGHGANVNCSDEEEGCMPLHWACKTGAAKAVVMLLEHGAKLDVTNKKGETPLQIAEAMGFEECVGAIRPFLVYHHSQTEVNSAHGSLRDSAAAPVVRETTDVQCDLPSITLIGRRPEGLHEQFHEQVALLDHLFV